MHITYGTKSLARKCSNFYNSEDTRRPIPLPKSQAGWKNRTAKRWALLKGTGAKGGLRSWRREGVYKDKDGHGREAIRNAVRMGKGN